MRQQEEKLTWRVIRGDAHAAMTQSDANTQAEEQAELAAAWERFTARAAGETAHPAWERARASEVHADPDSALVPADVRPVAGACAAPPMAADQAPRERGRSRRRRAAWRIGGSAAAIAAVVCLCSSGLASAALADMFQTFTVSSVTTTNAGDLQTLKNAIQSLTANGKPLQLDQFGEVSAQEEPVPQTVTLADATSRLGFSVPALPGADTNAVKLWAGTEVTLRLHVSAVNDLLQRLGGTASFPQAVDEQPIVIQANPVLQESTPDGSRKLEVTKLPTMQVPSSVDVDQVRQALLSLPFLPDDIRADLANPVTWAHTVMIPNAGNLQQISINGNSAVVDTRHHQVVWFADGRAYRLYGSGSAFPNAAALTAAAKELTP